MAEVKLTVGNVEILVMHDAEAGLPLEMTFPNVTEEAWAPYKERFPEAFNGSNLRAHFECYLTRSQGQTILVDTGIGTTATNPGTIEGLLGGSVEGKLVSELSSAGIQPGDIDMVFMTHLHPDHVGWNLTNGKPNFPNARYLVPRADWDYWTQPSVMKSAGYIRSQVIPLNEMKLMDLIDGDYNITDELTTVATPGHTPGHISIAIASQGERGYILGDVAHSTAQAHYTDWSPVYDVDQELSRRTRHTVLDMLEKEGILVSAGHYPDPGFGRFLRGPSRRYWQGV